MPNDPRFHRIEVPVESIQLDRANPRISLRPAADDRACIERLAEGKSEQLYVLARDISDEGLSIEPIIVAKDADGGWTVKDGNRRIAVLKMLSNPLRAPQVLVSRIERLAQNIAVPLPSRIECYTTEDAEALTQYILRRHTGTGEGEGQLPWEALEKAFFELSTGERGQHDLAARVLRYAENEGVRVAHTFPVTTLTRLLNRERLGVLGIEDISSDPPVLSVDSETVRARLVKITTDIQNGSIHVRRGGEQGSIYESEQQEKYIAQVIAQTEPTRSADKTQTGAAQSSAARSSSTTAGGVSPPWQPTVPASSGQAVSRGSTTPTKQSWDRNRVILRRTRDGVRIPQEHKKARDIHRELQYLNVEKATIGAGMLVRAFIELAVMDYVQRHSLQNNAKNLAKGMVGLRHYMEAAAVHMKNSGHIDHNQMKAIVQRTRQEHLSLDTLHGIVHSPDFLPDRQTVNSFWDGLREFLNLCWNA